MRDVFDFLYCTLTSVGVFALLAAAVGIVVYLVWGIGWIWNKLAERRPFMVRLGNGLLYSLLVIPAGIIVLLVIGLHDMGCDIHGHPEHKIIGHSVEHTHKP